MTSNPWLHIKLDDYEGHMFASGVEQGQLLRSIMSDQAKGFRGDIIILGVANGNGVYEIAQGPCQHIYGYDINPDYIHSCRQQFLSYESIEFFVKDLSKDQIELREPSLLIANLIIEYLGIENFLKIVKDSKGCLERISLVIQRNGPDSFVTQSPFSEKLESLDTIHQVIEEGCLIKMLRELEYDLLDRKIYPLVGNKFFIRLDFSQKDLNIPYRGEER